MNLEAALPLRQKTEQAFSQIGQSLVRRWNEAKDAFIQTWEQDTPQTSEPRTFCPETVQALLLSRTGQVLFLKHGVNPIAGQDEKCIEISEGRIYLHDGDSKKELITNDSIELAEEAYELKILPKSHYRKVWQ